jgi:type III secretion system low calcium response chaperone LcrH/SycD
MIIKTVSEEVDLASWTEEQFTEALTKLLIEGVTLKTLKGIDDSSLEAVYTVAYNAYQAGNFGQAEPLLKFLCYFNHLSQKYWLALGANRQSSENLSGAVGAYSFAGLLKLEDPRAPFHAAECHIKLGNLEAAVSGLEAAVRESTGKQEFHSIEERATALLGLIKERNQSEGE